MLGGLLAALYLMIMTGLAIAMFGAELVAMMSFPVYSLVQQVSIGEFVERLDVFVIAMWLFGMITKVSAHLWVATNSLAFTLGMKNERRLLPVLALVALYLMMRIPNLLWLVEVSNVIWTPLSLSAGLGISGLLLVASWVRGLRNRPRRSADA